MTEPSAPRSSGPDAPSFAEGHEPETNAMTPGAPAEGTQAEGTQAEGTQAEGTPARGVPVASVVPGDAPAIIPGEPLDPGRPPVVEGGVDVVEGAVEARTPTPFLGSTGEYPDPGLAGLDRTAEIADSDGDWPTGQLPALARSRVPYPPPPAAYPPPYPTSAIAPYTMVAPQPAPFMVVHPPNSGTATASLVLGIVGFVAGWCLCLIPNLLAIILGHIGLSQTKSGALGGRGMAVAGVILGYVSILPIVVFLFVYGGFAVLGGLLSVG